MLREFTDPFGETYEVVWDGTMDISLTGERLTKPNPVFDTPATERPKPEKRLYNKTGRHAKDPNFWKVRYEED